MGTSFTVSAMGFKKVFLSLEELFPQIDPRALRAVAIEHSKDVDAAVMAVLDEIVPFFIESPTLSSPLTRSFSMIESSHGALVGTAVGRQQSSGNADDLLNEPIYDASDGHHVEDKISEATLKTHESKLLMCADVYSPSEPVVMTDENLVDTLQIEISGDPEMQETISGDKCPESSIKIPSDSIAQHTLETSQAVSMGVREKENEDSALDFSKICNEECHLGKSFEESKDVAVDFRKFCSEESHLEKSFAENEDGAVDFSKICNEESHLGKSFVDGDSPIVETSLSTDIASGPNPMSNSVGTEEDSTLNVSHVTMSQSSEIRIINVIEEAIADARHNKNTLFSAMDSMVDLMRQVELKEQAAEQAKVEAGMGDMNILDKVEELKQMLHYAKEANDMHAGEVYGEKAILATELRELQSQVRSLSNERDKSVAVLDEMSQTLQVRLAAAENEIKSAEQEKLEKEKAAWKSLDDQDIIMENVVQESKILKQQAEENAKLQEFLLDRGRVVDTLQGEIAVICQDVRQLKEKFDQRVRFSKSLISSHTSFILASSNSSLKSLVLDQVQPVPVGDDNLSETQKNSDHEEDAVGRDDRKALQDEEWELLHFRQY